MAAPGEYLFNTSLQWRSNGELSTREQHAAHALVMAADGYPFQLTSIKPMTYVALVADSTGRYAHVYGNANSWSNFIDQLEDIGCEVIENQTDDYDSFAPEDMEESGTIHISKLLKETDFVAYG